MIRVIRYQTRPESAEENQRLVEQVFAELADKDPGDVRYATFRLDDGVTFVHIATSDGESSSLTQLPAFEEFQRQLGDRVVGPPVPHGATVVGSYGLLAT